MFVARLTQDFSRCVGIEILSGLHQQARVIVDRYNQNFRSLLCAGQNQHASVYWSSFLDFDWSDGDVVFANSTCYDDSLMESMASQAELMKAGSIFVTFTKGLPSKKFELIERKRYRMSWGPATVFIQRRLKDKGQPLSPYRLNTFPSDDIEYSEENENGNNYSTNMTSDYTSNNSGRSTSGTGGGAGIASVMSSATFSIDEDEDDEPDYDFNDDEDSMRAVIHPSNSQLYKRLLHQQTQTQQHRLRSQQALLQQQQRPSTAPTGASRVGSAASGVSAAGAGAKSASSTPARVGKQSK